MNVVERAKEFARRYHRGQVDKAGQDYFFHLETVANSCGNDFLKVVAYLHDIVEDTECSLADVRKEFGDRVADTVDHLTRREDERYFDYIERVKLDENARFIKYLDALHNSDTSRFGDSEYPLSLMKRYNKSISILIKESYPERL